MIPFTLTFSSGGEWWGLSVVMALAARAAEPVRHWYEGVKVRARLRKLVREDRRRAREQGWR